MVVKINYRLIICISAGIMAICLLIRLSGLLGLPEAEREAIKHVNGIKVPIILYHSILESRDIKNRYAVTPEEFENDLNYIRDHGYETVTMDDLIDYVYNNEALPDKPVIITFDDGYLNTYMYAYPLLEEYDMKAVLSIIGNRADAFTREKSSHLIYAHVNWDQIREMKSSGRFEIQNHSYNLHTSSKGRYGAKIKRDESLRQYEEALTEDIGTFQEQIAVNTGYIPTTFTYPYGRISPESVDILRKLGFKATLSTDGGINIVNRDPDLLFGLKRNDRPHGIPSQLFFIQMYEISGLKCTDD